MIETVTERELAQQLTAALAGIATVRWGFRELETAEAPPSLPLVVLQRTSADAGSFLTMCDPEGPAIGTTTVQTRTWVEGYENARDLNTQVRDTVRGAGWNLLAELDTYDPTFRAWCITGEYTAVAEPLL